MWSKVGVEVAWMQGISLRYVPYRFPAELCSSKSEFWVACRSLFVIQMLKFIVLSIMCSGWNMWFWLSYLGSCIGYIDQGINFPYQTSWLDEFWEFFLFESRSSINSVDVSYIKVFSFLSVSLLMAGFFFDRGRR